MPTSTRLEIAIAANNLKMMQKYLFKFFYSKKITTSKTEHVKAHEHELFMKPYTHSYSQRSVDLFLKHYYSRVVEMYMNYSEKNIQTSMLTSETESGLQNQIH